VAREVIRVAVGKVYSARMEGVNVRQVVQWFELGGAIKLPDSGASRELLRQLDSIQGLMELTPRLGVGENEPDALRVAAAEFLLEGLYAHRRISRNEELAFVAEERKRQPVEPVAEEEEFDPRRSRKQRRNFN
jgi:magnesium chelatase subunit I